MKNSKTNKNVESYKDFSKKDIDLAKFIKDMCSHSIEEYVAKYLIDNGIDTELKYHDFLKDSNLNSSSNPYNKIHIFIRDYETNFAQSRKIKNIFK